MKKDEYKPKIREKSWNPELEESVLSRWQKDKIYEWDTDKDAYTIDTPPPYPSGRPWHIGAAAHYAQIDMIARTARMNGKNVYFPIGIDRNGLPVEIYTEKKHGIRMRETDRERFLEMCKESLDQLEQEMMLIMKNLGISGLLDNHYRTDSAEYRELTQSTFIKLWKQKKIVLATRPNNYDWVTGTTIADAEITHQEMPTNLVHMRFKLENSNAGGGEIVIASTRPELLCACKTVIVNPDDDRYVDIVGKRVIVPITGDSVTIQTHHSARPDFGSGAVMVCSYGDQNDVALFRELGLQEVAAIGLDGKMTDAAGKEYAGLRPRQARQKITKELQERGLAVKIEEIMHKTPVSERSKTPIELVPMQEYYLKQIESVDRTRELGAQIKFHPGMHKTILDNWLDSIAIDWPISRRRYYGTEIPVWYCDKCQEPYVPPPGGYYQPWKQKCPADRCAKCDGVEFTGDERTFDTWMDSSVSPLFVTRYGKDEDFFKKTYPTAIRPQAKDIVRTWLYYTLLRCDQLTGQKPWSEAWIMGYGLDERGKKMSKSKGNAIDPMPIIKEFGADTFRFWSASEVNHGQDFRCNVEKIASAKKFLSKLWNISRLLSSFPLVKEAVPTDTDRWILEELENMIQECKKGYLEYNFFIPAVAAREFTWNVFAAHYVEMVKGRAYGGAEFTKQEQDAAIYTLHTVLAAVLKVLAPITPFITDYLWRELYADASIHQSRFDFGDIVGEAKNTTLTKEIIEFNSGVWNEKKRKGLSLRDPISVDIPDGLSSFKKDLAAMHNLKRA